MSVINTQPLIGASGQGGAYNLERSLRLRRSASAYLARTPASNSNRKTYTISMWTKRGALGINCGLFEAELAGKTTYIGFGTNDQILVQFYDNTYNSVWNTTAVYRDPSAWYHIVWVVDTTQASPANMVKIWVNGVQVSLTLTHYSGTIPQNYDTWINSTNGHRFGSYAGLQNYYDGYYSETHFVDGQALTPSSFGETDTITGVWKPKRYTGTYGTNGFYLKFNNLTSTSTLGNDSSGNGNTWTVNNVSLTAGATYDSMTDVPTLTSATAANYCVLNPLDKNSSATVTNGNLTGGGPGWSGIKSTIGMSSGKWYCEITQSASGQMIVGITTAQAGYSFIGADANGWGYGNSVNGLKYTNGSGVAYGPAVVNGDVIGIAFDHAAGTLTFYRNNTNLGVAFSGLSTSQTYFFSVSSDATTINANFGQRPFAYTPPSGFVALNTYNLPDSTIVAGNEYMDATTYTGTGSAQSITNAGSFKPDLVWLKNRNDTYWHFLYDSNRGATKRIQSNNTDAEATSAQGLTAFNSNGFSIGTQADINTNAYSFVGWQWQAGQGTTSSNTSGSITSTVSVNAAAGFSIVTYTGTGVSNATVGHGLGVAPKMVILKSRSTNSTSNNWWVNHASLSSGNNLYLNTGDAQFAVSGTTSGGLGTLSSTTFTLANGSSTNNNTNQSGGTFVAYCWSEIAGFSKFGSFTANANADGPFIYLGFKPKFILFKKSSGTGDWMVLDTARDSFNVATKFLLPNSSNTEASSQPRCDFLSNGIKVRAPSGFTPNETNGDTYIYAAFAENPFKNSLAR